MSDQPKTIFLLWDTRAIDGDTDDAIVLCTADTEAEAVRLGRDFDGIWHEYERIQCPVSKEAPSGFYVDEGKARYDLPPFSKEQTRVK